MNRWVLMSSGVLAGIAAIALAAAARPIGSIRRGERRVPLRWSVAPGEGRRHLGVPKGLFHGFETSPRSELLVLLVAETQD